MIKWSSTYTSVSFVIQNNSGNLFLSGCPLLHESCEKSTSLPSPTQKLVNYPSCQGSSDNPRVILCSVSCMWFQSHLPLPHYLPIKKKAIPSCHCVRLTAFGPWNHLNTNPHTLPYFWSTTLWPLPKASLFLVLIPNLYFKQTKPMIRSYSKRTTESSNISFHQNSYIIQENKDCPLTPTKNVIHKN